jgi:hypothetical protein
MCIRSSVKSCPRCSMNSTRCWRHEVGPDSSDSVAPILGLLNLPDTVWRIAAKASTEGVEHFRGGVSGVSCTTHRLVRGLVGAESHAETRRAASGCWSVWPVTSPHAWGTVFQFATWRACGFSMASAARSRFPRRCLGNCHQRPHARPQLTFPRHRLRFSKCYQEACVPFRCGGAKRSGCRAQSPPPTSCDVRNTWSRADLLPLDQPFW